MMHTHIKPPWGTFVSWPSTSCVGYVTDKKRSFGLPFGCVVWPLLGHCEPNNALPMPLFVSRNVHISQWIRQYQNSDCHARRWSLEWQFGGSRAGSYGHRHGRRRAHAGRYGPKGEPQMEIFVSWDVHISQWTRQYQTFDCHARRWSLGWQFGGSRAGSYGHRHGRRRALSQPLWAER